MIVRITRHPLTDEQIADLRAKGQLPDDYADRAAIATDFVKVDTDDDCAARDEALAKTRLTIKGETVELHEANGPEYRELICE